LVVQFTTIDASLLGAGHLTPIETYATIAPIQTGERLASGIGLARDETCSVAGLLSAGDGSILFTNTRVTAVGGHKGLT
tara:strand:- start:483 stop:719 length:237 start_codon:yes stop_codon:yes gene_type:complete